MSAKSSSRLISGPEHHSSYNIVGAQPEFMFKIATELEKFGIKPGDPPIPISGLDVILWFWEKDDIKLEMSWDIWSDFTLVSKSDAGDEFMETFALHLDKFLAELKK